MVFVRLSTCLSLTLTSFPYCYQWLQSALGVPRFPSGSQQGCSLLSGLDGSLQSSPHPMTNVTAGVGEQEGGSHFVWTLGSSRCSDSFTPPGPREGAVPLSILQMRKQEMREITPAGREARSRLDVCSALFRVSAAPENSHRPLSFTLSFPPSLRR